MPKLSVAAAVAALAIVSVAPASAGPAEDLARGRIAAIAGGDLPAVTGAYAPGATLVWVGGPLDGSYATPDSLRQVWSRFFAAQGTQTATVSGLSEAANPKGATVTADVAFAGKNTVRVRYVLVYRDGHLVDEIWQVNPAAAN